MTSLLSVVTSKVMVNYLFKLISWALRIFGNYLLTLGLISNAVDYQFLGETDVVVHDSVTITAYFQITCLDLEGAMLLLLLCGTSGVFLAVQK